MMKVLLIGIYDTNTAALAPEVLRAYVSQFPIAAQYDIQTLNLSIFSQTVDDMVVAIERENADIIGFSTYIWNIQPIRQIVPRISGTIILGGPECNDSADELLAANPGISIVVSGEGELTFKELLEHFAGQRSLEGIEGITTPHYKGPRRSASIDIDTIPSPYPRILQEHPDLEWIAYETSRGCPFLCGFCTWGYSKAMRYHTVERVLSDLDLLLAQPSFKRLYLADSSILLKKDRAKAILRHIIEKNRDIVVRYEFMAEHLDDEIIDLLLQLPENEFNFGLQTTNPRALKIMRRPFKRQKFEENYAKMMRRRPDTFTTIDVIYGLPGDDLDGFKESLNYAMSFEQVKWILTNPLILLPGADYCRDAVKHGIVLRDDDSRVVESTATFSAADMREAIKLSFWASVVFFNGRLREAMKAHAAAEGMRVIDAIVEFFSALPFSLIEDDLYPYMVPSVAEDFRHRNRALFHVIQRYPYIVKFFNEFTAGAYAEELADYEQHFLHNFRRFEAFATAEAHRAGLQSPPVPQWEPGSRKRTAKRIVKSDSAFVDDNVTSGDALQDSQELLQIHRS